MLIYVACTLNGLSVPDADVLIDMANLLGVSANQLLGLEEDNNRNENLSMELARLKEQLEKQDQKEKLQLQVSRKRGFILALSFLTMVIAMSVKNDLVSIILVGGMYVDSNCHSVSQFIPVYKY